MLEVFSGDRPLVRRLPVGTRRRAIAAGAVVLAAAGGAATAVMVTRHPTPHHVAVTSVAGSAPWLTAGRGAAVPFVEQQAVHASTNGTVLAASRDQGNLAAEAVGRTAVTLAGRGKYVEFTLTQPANSLNVRYSIPDRADGTAYDASLSVYVNGAKRNALNLTNKFSWYYGSFPFTNTPSNGNAHHFYDESHQLLGVELAAGSKVRFQVDARDTASSYTIDLVDFEEVAAPRLPPGDSISVSHYGADPSGATDSSAAFRASIAAASAEGKTVWIPAGRFQVNKHLILPDNITVQGAGEWYSVLTGDGIGLYGNSAPTPSINVHLAGFAIDGTVDARDDAAQVNGIGGAMGGGSTISDIWISHTKVGMWLDGPFDGLSIVRCRIDDTAADGINLHDGITHATITGTFIRNTGDDGIAMWSEHQSDTDDAITFNTVEVPVLANNIALYGGADNSVTDNVVSDTQTQGGGIHLANRFNAVAMSGTTTVARDTTLRAGVLDPNWKYGVGALWFWSNDSPMTGAVRVSDVDLIDSSYEGIQFTGSSVSNVAFDKVTIDGAGTFAVQLEAHGSATFKNVLATNVGAPAGVYNCLFTGSSESAFTVTDRGGNSGWNSTYCGQWPTPVHTYAYPSASPPADFSVATKPAAETALSGRAVSATVLTSVVAGGTQSIRLSASGMPAGVSVRFDLAMLSSGGTRNMTVTTESSVAAGTYPITVTATGPAGVHSATYALTVAPVGGGALIAVPTSLTFSAQAVGTPSAPQDIRVRNTGTSPLGVSSIDTSGDFGQTNNCGDRLAPGAFCTVSVTFAPTGAGSRTGALRLSGDSAPVIVRLSGSATASANLALGKAVQASGTQDGYPTSNATDGNPGSYWESTNNHFPQSVTVDLGAVQRVRRIVLALPPPAEWSSRSQTMTVSGSADGITFFPILPSAGYTFNPATGNTVTISLPAAAQARYVRLTVTANTGWPAAQLSEFEVFP